MTIRRANGTAINKTTLTSLTTTVEDPPAIVTVTEEIYQDFTQTGAEFENAQRLLFVPGQRITQAEIDAVFEAATITSIAPATGPAAGGTPVTIKGTNFSGATSATIGGTAVTSFTVVNDTTITGVTPAKAAGAYNVVVVDDSGSSAPLTNGFTYS